MEDEREEHPAPQKRKAGKRPPKNFVIAWKEEENGPTIGYLVAELVVYFPASVDDAKHLSGQQNAANPAFGELFAPSVGKRVLLEAVALPSGVVADSSFRAEVASMSGDFYYRDAD